MQNTKPGMLVAIEGIDGAGKSTLARHLYQALEQNGIQAVLTKEPGGSKLGAYIRSLIQERPIPIAPKAEFLLFAADRAQHVAETIIPALMSGKIVISDRMSDSSVVYQGYGRGLDINFIKQINNWIMEGRMADITFYLKISPQEARRRLEERGQALSVYEEQHAFVKKLAQGFDELFANRSDVIILDGTLPIETLTKQAVKTINLWRQ